MFVKKSLLTLIFIFTGFSLFANMPELRIRYYDKDIYYPDSTVQIKIELYNNTNETMYFKVADQRAYNLMFQVHNLQHMPLQPSEMFLRLRENSRPYSFRVLALEPEETYGFVVDLNDYIDLESPGMYVVEGMFYPDLAEENEVWESNKLTLSILPETEERYWAEIEEATLETLRQSDWSPDKIVEYTITARQEESWNRFFLYLDLESLMLQNERNRRVYNNSTEEERFAMVRQYRQQLVSRVLDTDRDGLVDADRAILELPFRFEILNTSYDTEEARVIVREFFDRVNYIEVKRYTYYLHKKDGIWNISGYDVVNEENIGKSRENTTGR